jgi:murein DD-endopeptidase MepM/ murein hydrolase activator NlpD
MKDKLKALYYSKKQVKRYGYGTEPKGRAKRFALILSLPFIFLILAYVIYQFFFIPEPVIEGIDDFSFLPLEKTITLNGKNLKSIDISVTQGDQRIEILRDIPDSFEKKYTLHVKPVDMGLNNGPAIVTIKARSGILKEIKADVSAVVDTIPPSLNIVHAPYQIHQGTGGFSVLRSENADSVFIRIADYMFKAFRSSGSIDSEAGAETSEMKEQTRASDIYFVFFPAPFHIEKGEVFYAVAQDTAGNQTIRALPTKLRMKNYTSSSITVSDSFINTVIPPLLNEIHIPDPAGAFKKVNEELRKKDQDFLMEVSAKTAPEMLWKDRFLQLKNTQVMAKYGDRRTYVYNGVPVSKSVHLGYDLASVEKALVEAANSGAVIFAGDLGIYGNTVIIDHGIGLMSLYGHLSSINVKKGFAVEKGEVIGTSGSTGLAGGDHLHFGILMHGHEISPLHWWDKKWIKVNVIDHLTR